VTTGLESKTIEKANFLVPIFYHLTIYYRVKKKEGKLVYTSDDIDTKIFNM
jgi:hypothetical protein